MSEKLRVGLIGANVSYGWSPRAHIPALLALPGVELAAVCTARPETARESAERFGVPMAFSDHMEMLERDDLDAMGVSVRVPKHHALTMDVLRAGSTSTPSGPSARTWPRPRRWPTSPGSRGC